VAKESPLAEIHRSNGAEFAEENGWLLPARFGDPMQEYQGVRSHVGLLDFCHRGILRFTGPDRVSFLQGMVSNDVKKLSAGEGIAAAVLNIQGKILADCRVLCTQDSLLVDLWEFLKDKIAAHLDRYLIADEVEIADLSGELGILCLQGPMSGSLLKEFLEQAEIPAAEHSHRTFSIQGTEVRVIRSSYTGEEGYDLMIKRHDLSSILPRLRQLGGKFGARWVGSQALEILRVEAGIPWYGSDMTEDNLLLEAGLERAVSFQKGCYLGQEVVERIRSRGHVNKRLAGIVLDGDSSAATDDPVHADHKEIGRITTSVFSPFLKRHVALGYIHRDYLGPETPVSVKHDSELVKARIAALPFYERQSRS
jgi:folate-binding protein YgfZ